jgi:hypothetical protein
MRVQARWCRILSAATLATGFASSPVLADCGSPANAIEAENCLPGHPPSEWDVAGDGDDTIQGFATDISVNRGGTIQFKVKTPADGYRVDIYRVGYYAGNGARRVATVTPSAPLPQAQPDCAADGTTGLLDCGNWAASASWTVPGDAVSGVYIARFVRNDTAGASHALFVVRHDGGSAAILFQTSDATWQAYNRYGGNSLYVGTGPGGGVAGVGRAYKASYNRPVTTREYAPEAFFFNAEYPLVRWLERNGYDVAYSSGVDTDRLGPELARHRVFLSAGQDEYWTRQQRTNVETARDQQFPGQTAPVNLAFLGGNDVFWKSRWEPSIAGPLTAYRTLVCYKETHEGAPVDPSPEWTGTWRDARPINTGGANPENALTGTLFTVGCCAYPLEVRLPEAARRFWRNTPNVSQLSAVQVWTGPPETIGHQWNEDVDNGSRPPGLVSLARTPRAVPDRLLDFGSLYGPGTAVHSLAFHRRPNGALVFSAGSVQWAWGLDDQHDRGSGAPSPDMQQATVNLLADMGVQPATLDPSLVPAAASTDAAAPSTQFTSPAAGATVPMSVPVAIQGTAADAPPGRIGAVEVSIDAGASWHPAAGAETWSYSWTPTQTGTYVLRARSADDSGNLESPGATRTVFVGPPPPPPGGFTIWPPSATPALTNQNDGNPIGLGVKFRSSSAGYVHAVRFYKGSQDNGTHVGRLWTSTGTVLAAATFTNETPSGWQQVQLPSPVPIAANTTYVASYHSSAGYYSTTDNYFAQATVNGPLTALANGTDGPNGVYRYSPTAFPNQTYQQSNYWVDIVFVPDGVAPTVVATAPPNGATDVPLSAHVTATFDEALASATVNSSTVVLRDPAMQAVAATVTWDPVARVASLNPAASLQPTTTYTATVLGGPAGVTDSVGNPLAADVSWSFVTEDEDLSPPTVDAFTPSSGEANVLVGSNVVVTFSEPLDPATVNAATLQLRTLGGSAVPAAVAWHAPTASATLDPTSPLAFFTTYVVTVAGGPSGVKDLAGNPLAADATWQFTTEANFVSASIWPGPVTPAVPNANDGTPIELGVRFRASAAGYITAIRFHKGNQDTGAHVGSLWTGDGQLLASAPFVGETASGWQQAALPTPVPIAANTTYVASYHSSAGYYAATLGYFAQAAVNGPLTALADGTDGGNGLYLYGASAFPVNSASQANYWVDVVFSTNPPGPDATPPAVIGRTPADGAVAVLVGMSPAAHTSEPLAAATVNTSTMELRDASGQLVPASVAWVSASASAVLDPTASLAYATVYTVTVKGGPGGVTDVAGNPLPADVSWTFTTQAAPPPPPEEGPGGPILVIANAANPFTRYYAEILRAEGVNAFRVLDVTQLDAALLDGFDVAILGEMALTAGQVSMLETWVASGGNLVAMRPDPQLADLLGISPVGGTLADAYLQVDTSGAPGRGIAVHTLQFHGAADRYSLGTASAVATLFSTIALPTAHPAVTTRAVGLGTASAFTFDLARSIVYTRQGNPAWSGDERDGFSPIRSDDLFYGAKAGDPQPDWIDLDRVAIPQADEQQRLLANLILHVNRDRTPLPRFWYLPYGEKAAVVMTSDNHANGARGADRLDRQLAQDPPGCDVDKWECIRSTLYLYPAPFNPASYHQQGFELAVHVSTGCADWTEASLDAAFTDQLAQFAQLPQFAGIPAPTTNRTHCIAWSDWATHAKVELQHGIRFDGNYYYWPGSWVANRPGFFTGSGMPMRFADLDGATIDVYQSATQITDESGQPQPFTINTLLDRALGSDGYYAVINANIHSDFGDETLADAIVASAKARGVPVVSARQMLTWLDGRNGSTFGAITWSGDVLDFDVAVAAGAAGLRAMLPAHAGGSRVLSSITRAGSPVGFDLETVKGVDYAVFAAAPGAYRATYIVDLDAPALSAISVAVGTNGTATVHWLTDEAASSRVDYGTDPANLSLSVAADGSVTSHHLPLTGLSVGTYYYRVTSGDPSGNVAISAPASFEVTVVDTTPPVVGVVRPNGGERVFAGTPYVVQWTATDDVGVAAVDVAFSSNAGATFTAIAECTNLPGSAHTCTWNAPGPVTTSQGRIRVTARDAAGLSAFAVSAANFNVVAGSASLTLTAPVTAVTWRIANSQNITFNHNLGAGQRVAVEVTRDAGGTWTAVNPAFVTTNGSNGSVPWVVTGPPTAAARARVVWSGNPGVSSASPANFTIIDRLNITAPNTAVSWTIGSNRSITWSHNLGATGTVNIDLSRDGGATWTPLATNVPQGATTGTYSWTVSGPATAAGRVRITSAGDPAIQSTSAVDFVVSGTLDVTEPTGSSVWSIGSTRTVAWTHNLGEGQTFAIDLSTDNGATYPISVATAVPGAAASGDYQWLVPGPVTATARIRVRWTGSAAVSDNTGAFDMVNPVVTVTAPNTAVSWAIGSTRTITWTHNLGAVNFDITLSTDGGVTYPTTIATAVPGGATSGSYVWIVSGPATGTARVRVSASADPALRGQSAVNFTMAAPVLTLSAPNTAVNWAIGTTRAVTWNHNLGAGETVAIEKSLDGGATWTAIAASAPNGNTSGTFNWPVVGPPSTTARMRVSWTANGAVADQSAVNFTISAPSLLVTAPNTAVAWAVGSSQNITFNHNLGPGVPVALELTRDGGATWSPLATVTTTNSANSTFAWVVSGPSTTQARVRATAGSLATDMSDADFTIQFTIAMTSPNTAVSWGIGSLRAVTWTHNFGAGHLFDISLSTDGGATYPIVVATGVAGAAATGTFDWTVSGPVSTTARIRVSSAADPTVRGQSAVNFAMAEPVITVTAPTAGTGWAVGTTRAITWNHNLGSREAALVERSADGGATWTTLAAGAGQNNANGTFGWTVSDPESATSRVRVSWSANPAVTAVSAEFTVGTPAIAVTSPNTAVVWPVGTAQNVTFTHNLGTGVPVAVEVSRDGGATFTLVTNFTTTNATTGSVPWTVTDPPTTQARIRVAWSGGAADASDVDFEIR